VTGSAGSSTPIRMSWNAPPAGRPPTSLMTLSLIVEHPPDQTRAGTGDRPRQLGSVAEIDAGGAYAAPGRNVDQEIDRFGLPHKRYRKSVGLRRQTMCLDFHMT